MSSIEDAQKLVDKLTTSTKPNLTQLRAIAKAYGKNQETADELWMHGATSSRLLALLVLDLKAMNTRSIERMIADVESAAEQDQRQLCDWLIANVIMTKSALKKEAMTWLSEQSAIKQRVFWSVPARTIKAENQAPHTHVLEVLETRMVSADAMVQETMNWCAAQIGIVDAGLRGRCIQLGERLGLYQDYPVSKGCTSPYLPVWIESVVGKQALGNGGRSR
ncbi:MAG: DNA alkylation repair protein [Chloroflexota bacterium]|nr:DNA alkylation repair protein [Chloroflexota bacterium]